jgi:hypothetical protein
MDAKDPTDDDGDDSMAPKRSAVNEEGEHPFFLPSIIYIFPSFSTQQTKPTPKTRNRNKERPR